MFAHIFTYRLKCILRDRQMVFWTVLFPIVLATLFFLAFGHLDKAEKFEKIPVAVVNNAFYDSTPAFRQAISSASGTDGTALFKLTICNAGKAKQLLDAGSVDGYLVPGDSIQMVVKGSGINQTILKAFADSYLQTSSAAGNILRQNPAALRTLQAGQSQTDYLRTVSPTKAAPNDTLTYYYALIALACMYGGFWGIKEMGAIQANLSAQAARVNLAPVHKLKVFGYSLCAALCVQLISIFLLVGYLGLVLGVSFGPRIGFVLLACVAGSLLGVSLGAMIAALIKKGDLLQIAVLITLTMFGSFLSGLMASQVKYYVTTALPFMAYINPANLISDSFYALYYYTSMTRYWVNLGLMFAFSLVFGLIVYFSLRRHRYASL